ncbi:hypothetical protein [Sulfitobacter sp. R18_1]|uniref:hypothetical protein n=1 Tax=Sulfitobacter sp. R18_1 TaxID=2821104 RepID=UPI001ADB1AFC|nr:hypothetical protein [Sulfitobacter sp. R18_1]MBO9428125.1 hypothetical protein [Sulfitobacter sp. R18_1]
MAEIKSKDDACPDGGTCHHGCAEGNCFRVGFCGPLSNVFPNNTWPSEMTFDQDAHVKHLESLDASQ